MKFNIASSTCTSSPHFAYIYTKLLPRWVIFARKPLWRIWEPLKCKWNEITSGGSPSLCIHSKHLRRKPLTLPLITYHLSHIQTCSCFLVNLCITIFIHWESPTLLATKLFSPMHTSSTLKDGVCKYLRVFHNCWLNLTHKVLLNIVTVTFFPWGRFILTARHMLNWKAFLCACRNGFHEIFSFAFQYCAILKLSFVAHPQPLWCTYVLSLSLHKYGCFALWFNSYTQILPYIYGWYVSSIIWFQSTLSKRIRECDPRLLRITYSLNHTISIISNM